MSMIEKVADALGWAMVEHGTDRRALARAAIQAMRSPTPRMTEAMRLANMNTAGGYDGPSGWEAAINAALQEGGKEEGDAPALRK